MSKAAQLAQGSKLYIAGSAGAAEVLTAIVLGYPTILAITGHAGVANGDVVTLAGFEGANAADLNALSFVVKNYATGATNDTFAIDVNTVGRTISVGSGTTTATPAAYTQVKEIKSIKPGSAKASEIDVTDLDSTSKEFEVGLENNGTAAVDFYDKVDDAGQQAVLAAYNGQTVPSWKIALTGGSIRTFDAGVTSFSVLPDIAVDGSQNGTFELKISGNVTRA